MFSGIYLTTVMAMTSVTVIMTVFVLNLHHRGPSTKPVPEWLKKIFIQRKYKQKRRRKNSHARPSDDEDGIPRSDSSPYIRNLSLRLTIENLSQELKSDLDNYDHRSRPSSTDANNIQYAQKYNPDPRLGDKRRGRRYASQYNDHLSNSLCDSTPCRYSSSYRDVINQYDNVTSPLLNSTGASCTKTNEEILGVLKNIIGRYEQGDHRDQILHEWRQIAAGVDTILFWIFFVGTLGSTLIVLVIAPITRFI